MMSMDSFKGIYPALLTPFDAEGNVNHESLRRLVRLNMDKGVDGFYVCGSTAEVFMLTLVQRKEILETVVAEAGGRCRIIAHVGCLNQEQAVELAKHAKGAGADAVSSVPPFYYQFSIEDIRRYYLALADATSLPVVVYNIPAYSGVKLTVDDLLPLIKDERFLGVKHTSLDFFMLERMKTARPDLVVFNGLDEVFLAGISMGADGGIGSTYNFMAEKFIRMAACYREGRMSEALLVQKQVNAIVSAMLKMGLMAAEKEALNLMGIPMGRCVKPFPELQDEQRCALRDVLIENGCVGIR